MFVLPIKHSLKVSVKTKTGLVCYAMVLLICTDNVNENEAVRRSSSVVLSSLKFLNLITRKL